MYAGSLSADDWICVFVLLVACVSTFWGNAGSCVLVLDTGGGHHGSSH